MESSADYESKSDCQKSLQTVRILYKSGVNCTNFFQKWGIVYACISFNCGRHYGRAINGKFDGFFFLAEAFPPENIKLDSFHCGSSPSEAEWRIYICLERLSVDI